MTTPSAADLYLLLPTLVLAAGACVLLLSEAFLTSGERRYQAGVAAVAAALALALAVAQLAGPLPPLAPGDLFFEVVKPDLFQAFVVAAISAGLLLSVLLSADFLRRRAAERGEYYALLLFAGAGMSLLALADDLVLVFIALELMSLSTYALAAWLRRAKRSTEAALKYFLLGSFSSALYLYGVALAYGATGSTRLDAVARAVAGGGLDPLYLGAAVALMVAGFGFKVAAVPFHMWAPDVYEGAPTPVTAFMAVGVKAAAFAAFFRVVAVGFAGASPLWGLLVEGLAILSMVVGNLLALPQNNVKRMLAYSSVGHAGFVLMGLSATSAAAGRVSGGEGLLFYLAAYTFAAVGAFGVASLVERRELDGDGAWDVERFAGLARRRPALAFFMAVFLLSLAGLPTTAGFLGKLLVFRAAFDAGQVALVVVGAITSALAAYYYLRVIVFMYFHADAGEPDAEPRSAAAGWSLGIACAAVFALGLLPGPVLEIARRGAAALFH